MGLNNLQAQVKNKIAVLIDGGHLRVYTRKAHKNFVPDYIEKVAHACALADEVIHRVLFYDCPPYNGSAIQPVTGTHRAFTGSDTWRRMSFRAKTSSPSAWEC